MGACLCDVADSAMQSGVSRIWARSHAVVSKLHLLMSRPVVMRMDHCLHEQHRTGDRLCTAERSAFVIDCDSKDKDVTHRICLHCILYE